jgi:hypothetical protein
MPHGLDTPNSAKRPFDPLKEKDKGAQRPSVASTVFGVRNAREAAHALAVLQQQRTALLNALDALQERTQQQPKLLPAYLVKRPGGGLLWRKHASRPNDQTRFELLSTTGLALLQDLSPAVQRFWLDLEAERLRLNLEWRLTDSAYLSLKHYLDRYTQLRHRRKSLPTE